MLSAKGQNEASQFPVAEALIPALASSMAAMAADSGDQFEKVADLLPVGIFRTDATGQRLYVNQCWTRIAGLTFEQAKNDGWLNAIHPDDRVRVKSEWERTVAEQRSLRSEYRFQSPSGQITWVIRHAVPELDSAGKLTGFWGTLTDITELKRIEEALRINEARFRLAFGFAPHGMALTAPGGRFLQVNRFLCQMLGYSEIELLRLRVHDICHPDELETSLAGARALLENQMQVLELERKFLHRDGGIVWIHLRKSLVRDGSGQPLYFVSHMQDITERKRAEDALRESEERYRRLVEVSKDGIVIHNYDKIVFVNPAAARILGARSVEQFANINLLDLVHPDFRAVVGQRMRELNEGATFQPFIRETLLRLDGTTVPVEAAGVPFVYGGKPAVQVILRDISETLRAEEERDRAFQETEAARDRLQLLSQRLVEVQELERRRIARELHDEIGQELTALRLNIEQCAPSSGADSEASHRQAAARAQKLLGVVRDLSLDLRPTMLDDLGLLPALLWHFDRYTEVSHIQVRFKHCGIEGRRFAPEIETAAYRIVQEALTNVLRHSGQKEVRVTIWLSEQNPLLSIQVEDAGRGFDVQAAFQSPTSSGLSGMRERASLLGGRLLIDSVPGQGTCVTAELPLEAKPGVNVLP